MSDPVVRPSGVLGSADAALVLDLAAFDRNVAVLREAVAPADLMLVLKNDAYGHGAVLLSERASAAGVRWFGCLDLVGAFELRNRADLPAEARLFSWLLLPDDDFAAACAAGVDLGVGSGPVLDAVLAAATVDAPARIHLKIDTGLNRNGFRAEDWPEAVRRVLEAEETGVARLVGVWSHISEASDDDDDAARARFVDAVALAEQAGARLELRHLAASAAGLARPPFRFDMVRFGAFCFGLPPAEEDPPQAALVEPIGSLRARVATVTDAGSVATVPIGMLQGIPGLAAGRVQATLDGRALPVLDVGEEWTALGVVGTSVAVGDEVVLFGSARRGESTAIDWAVALDTVGEEILLRIDRSLPRIVAAD